MTEPKKVTAIDVIAAVFYIAVILFGISLIL